MKERINQMFKDKLFLVMLVLGLLTIVAAAGVVTMRRGDGQEQNPYVDMPGQENLLAEESKTGTQAPTAGESNAKPFPGLPYPGLPPVLPILLQFPQVQASRWTLRL